MKFKYVVFVETVSEVKHFNTVLLRDFLFIRGWNILPWDLGIIGRVFNF